MPEGLGGLLPHCSPGRSAPLAVPDRAAGSSSAGADAATETLQLPFQLKNDPLRRLSAHARHAGEAGDILLLDRLAQAEGLNVVRKPSATFGPTPVTPISSSKRLRSSS